MGIILTILGIIVSIYIIGTILGVFGIAIKTKMEADKSTEEELKKHNVIKVYCPNCRSKQYCKIAHVDYMNMHGTAAVCSKCHKQFTFDVYMSNIEE